MGPAPRIELDRSAASGLSSKEAALRLRTDGPNTVPSARDRTVLRIIADVLREPMLALLLAGGIAYALLGSLVEAGVLFCFAGFSIVITVVQESRTERVLQSLRTLAAPRALVMRDGTPTRVGGAEVVCGDLLIVEQGDRVPADAVLIEAVELEVDESLLTGESLPVGKSAVVHTPTALTEQDTAARSQLYSGTMITRGRGTAQVTATGAQSQLGRIGVSLASLDIEAPRLRRQVVRIIRFSALGALAMTAAVVVLFGVLRGSWLEASLAGIAIGMALLPEEFPVVLAVFLAMGAWRISRIGVLTRRAAAIETLGAATVLCVDKTGTLTCNQMRVSELWLPGPGIVSLADGQEAGEHQRLLELAAQASAITPSDPMEAALREAAAPFAASADDQSLERTYPLTSDLLAMSNAWSRIGEDHLTVAAKGAPEAIVSLCGLAGREREAAEEAARIMAARGGRVLGLAEARIGRGSLTPRQQDLPLRFAGLVALADPLRGDVPDAVRRCRSAGVRVLMITGDHAATATAIARQAGIDAGELVTGGEIERLDDGALAERLKTVGICARTLPAHKLRIVELLKASGEVVAMTGDGVNDAPALKAAHIGLAMGRRGTDVAREAAALVLLDDEFASIVSAIGLGRRVYDNLRKAMAFIFSVHVPIAGLALLPLLTGLPILFGPIQIALLELIIDPVCALVFEAEEGDDDVLARPPRPTSEPLFSAAMIVRSVAQGALALLLLAVLFLAMLRSGASVEQVRATVFFALVSAIVALVLVDRAFGRSVLKVLLQPNLAFRSVLAGVVLGSVLILAVPALRRLLRFGVPAAWQLLAALAVGVAVLALLDGAAKWRPRVAG